MTARKTTRQVEFRFAGQTCRGYEIHQGRSDNEEQIIMQDHCIGTYIHGFLDNAPVLDFLLREKPSRPAFPTLRDFREEQYDRLASHVRRHVDISQLYDILKL